MTREGENITVQPIRRWPPRIREIASRNFRVVQVLDLPGEWGGKPHVLYSTGGGSIRCRTSEGGARAAGSKGGCGGKAIPPRTLKQSYNARGWGSANRPGRLGRLGRLGHPGHRALPDLLREVREKHHHSTVTLVVSTHTGNCITQFPRGAGH